MRHYTEDDLILLHYGETEDAAFVPHLAGCERCRGAYDELQRVFAAVDTAPVPERSAAYPAEVWQRVQARLDRPLPVERGFDWRSWFTVPRLSLAASVAVLVLIAFVAGRQTAPPAEPLSEQVRERVLLVAVGDHLERSQRLLIELSNTKGGPVIDFGEQQAAADELVRDNRLYRQSAARSGDETVTGLLEELERLLLDISNSPTQLAGTELIELRRRIEQRGILLKIRVIGGEARRAARTPAPEA